MQITASTYRIPGISPIPSISHLTNYLELKISKPFDPAVHRFRFVLSCNINPFLARMWRKFNSIFHFFLTSFFLNDRIGIIFESRVHRRWFTDTRQTVEKESSQGLRVIWLREDRSAAPRSCATLCKLLGPRSVCKPNFPTTSNRRS